MSLNAFVINVFILHKELDLGLRKQQR